MGDKAGDMRRRDLLASLALLPAAGCLERTGGAGDGTTTTPAETTTTTPAETSTTSPDETTTTPEATDWSSDFTLRNIECATEDAEGAMVTFDGSSIEVRGTAIGSDMCAIARIDRMVYDEMTKEFTVVVETVRQADEDTACAECISAVEYRLALTFTGTVPDTVTVAHRRDGTEKTITRATR